MRSFMEQDFRFGGIQRLYGDEAFRKLQTSHIAVIGLGGVGSWTVEALARSGVGELTLVDFDDVCVSNTNRQLPAMQGNVGKLKTHVLAERVKNINENIKVHIIDEAYEPATESLIFQKNFNGVVDAIDHGLKKIQLAGACKERNIPEVISGSAGGRVDFSKIATGDLSQSVEDPVLADLRKKLRQKWGFPRKGLMGLPCVYSTEKPTFYLGQGELSSQKPAHFKKPLDCSTGMGTVTHITGSFGFALSHLIIQKVIAPSISQKVF